MKDSTDEAMAMDRARRAVDESTEAIARRCRFERTDFTRPFNSAPNEKSPSALIADEMRSRPALERDASKAAGFERRWLRRHAWDELDAANVARGAASNRPMFAVIKSLVLAGVLAASSCAGNLATATATSSTAVPRSADASTHDSPHPSATEFDWMVGTWRGVRRPADGSPDAPLVLRVESLRDDGAQVECLRVDRSRGPYLGFSIRTIDRSSGRWTMLYANSPERPFARLLQSEGDASYTSWTSTTADVSGGSRLVFERSSDDSWTRTQFVSEDGGATWRRLFTDELRRDGDR
jgi:hypothetical protein